MKIGLFLDVDKTLTRDYIQHAYSIELGCEEEYIQIEQGFQDRKIDSAEFGRRLISIFASRQFTESRARELSSRIALQSWANELLSLKTDKYLVSSGPSYYIDRLAEQYRIAKENVCCSVYRFDGNGAVIDGCDAVSAQAKAYFVEQKSKLYDITIGIGDNPELDGPFVSQCTVPLLTVKTDGYIFIPTFNSAILLINKLSQSPEPARSSFEPQEKGLFEPKKLTIPELWSALSLESWLLLGGGCVGMVYLGFGIYKLLHKC